MPKERRLPIGFLSAHVTAATVHVLSRVSPITLAFSFINISSLSYTQSLACNFYPLLLSVCFPRLISSPLSTSLTVSALFHFFVSFSIVLRPLSFSPVTLAYVLPPSVFPVSFCLSPTFSPSHLTLNFKPCSLYLSPSIIVRLRR